MGDMVTEELLKIYQEMINDQMKQIGALSNIPTIRGIPSQYKKEDFIQHFKENPDLLQEIITELRRDKIENILKRNK
jgi:tetrahydromethanopterin S-methyltransferase subunit A